MAGIGGRETLRVVDVGCGEGATIGYLRELHPGWEVSGIDADPAFCAAGMTETGRAESLPFPDGSIDVILMECSLSKTEQPERAAAEAFRVLKTGGWLLISDMYARRREILFEQIKEQALAWSVSWVEPEEIDQIDILNSRIKAMKQAAEGLVPAADYLLVDGNRDHGSRYAIQMPHETVVKGDSRSASIAAASILAKVSRDRYMEEMAQRYPQYEFQRHKGYPTKLHYERLREYGPCPIHRRSYLKKL